MNHPMCFTDFYSKIKVIKGKLLDEKHISDYVEDITLSTFSLESKPF